MAAYTSSQAGNWADQSTWSGSGPPGDGDTATLNHAVPLATNVTIGTSPNDNTTIVLDIGASGRLILSAGVTLTLKGNARDAFGSQVTLNAGASIVFDASASGGTPVYKFTTSIGVWAINGTSGSHCAFSAASGHAFQLAGTFFPLTCTYCDFTRMAASTWTLHASSATHTITNNSFTSCGAVTLVSGGTTVNYVVNDNSFTSGTGTEDLILQITGTHTSGTRELIGNALGLGLVMSGNIGFTCESNVLPKITSSISSGDWASFAGNFVGDTYADFNRVGRVASINGNYFAMQGDNPHYLLVTAHDRNTTVLGNIFENTGDYVSDNGDCISPHCVSGFKITVKHNLVLPSSFPSATHTSGTLATHLSDSLIGGTFDDAARNVEYLHNTVYCQSPNDASQAAVDVAEGQSGVAGEVSLFKSNLFWSASATHGLKFSRMSGTTNALLTASGADYNWSYNLRDGDNGRGYNDAGGNLNLWDGSAATTSDADDAGVDDNGGTGDPQFVDATRNLVTWTVARGYGSTASHGIAALKLAPRTRIADLIDWVTDGFAPQNADLEDAGHDGVTIGAVEGVFAQPVTDRDLWAKLNFGSVALRRNLPLSTGAAFDQGDLQHFLCLCRTPLIDAANPSTLVGRWANVIEYTSPNAPRKYTSNRRLEYTSPNERS